MLSSPEIIGLIGLSIEANGFYSLQKKKVTEDSWRYLLCLFLGTGMIICSLMYSWNLPSAIWNISWGSIWYMSYMTLWYTI